MRTIKFRVFAKGFMYSHDQCIAQGLDPRTTKKINNSECHWMHFAVLNDKNGKEIYEGDLVKGRNNQSGGHWFRGVVSYRDGSFYIDSMKGFTYFRWIDYEIEIIGNVHSNPELL